MRICKRYNHTCPPILVNDKSIAWVTQTKYLGITLVSHSSFKCNWQSSKKQFFSSLNHIFFSLGSHPNASVMLSLFHSICLPILSYGIAALPLTSSDLHSFTFAFNDVFHKLFKSSSKAIIEQCQYFTGTLPFPIQYDLMRFTFLSSVLKLDPNCSDPLLQADFRDLTLITNKYNLNIADSSNCIKFKIWNSFKLYIDTIS